MNFDHIILMCKFGESLLACSVVYVCVCVCVCVCVFCFSWARFRVVYGWVGIVFMGGFVAYKGTRGKVGM